MNRHKPNRGRIILGRNPTERDGSGMSGPSPLVFELCTAIDRFHERVPDLSVSDVLAALGEVRMALTCAGAPKRRSGPNVVPISDYKRGSI